MRTKKEVIECIHRCAVLYGANLAKKNVLFVTINEGKPTVFETVFMPHNFMHLTRVISNLSSDLFYQAAFNNRLSVKNITLSKDGKTEQKLDILPQLMNIHRAAKMIGDYDNSRPLLIADKFAGTTAMALGFVNINNIFMPSTALKLDIRDITKKAARHRIAAIFIKPRQESCYTCLTYIAKGLTIEDVLPIDRVDSQNLTASFLIPRKDLQEK